MKKKPDRALPEMHPSHRFLAREVIFQPKLSNSPAHDSLAGSRLVMSYYMVQLNRGLVPGLYSCNYNLLSRLDFA